PDEDCRKAVQASELYVDGVITSQAIAAVQSRVASRHQRHHAELTTENMKRDTAAEAAAVVSRPTMRLKTIRGEMMRLLELSWRVEAIGERTARITEILADRCRLLRCIFGNPFHPPFWNDAWRSSTVVDLAESIYAEGGFDKMPILGDALEDA